MSWQVIEGECLDVLRGLPSGSVDAIVTDPPYAVTGDESSSVKRGNGVRRETQFFEAWLREQMGAWLRVVKPSGAFWFTCDWQAASCAESAAARLGLRRPSVGVWHRGGLGMGYMLRHVYECFVVIPLDGFRRFSTDEPDVWSHPWTPGNRRFGHSAEKPVDLMSRAIRLVAPPGGTILDPFCGSGTTGVAAVQTGRSFLGIEREAGYASVSRARIAKAAAEIEAA